MNAWRWLIEAWKDRPTREFLLAYGVVLYGGLWFLLVVAGISNLVFK